MAHVSSERSGGGAGRIPRSRSSSVHRVGAGVCVVADFARRVYRGRSAGPMPVGFSPWRLRFSHVSFLYLEV